MLAKMVCLRAWRCTVELFSDISLPFYLFSFSSSLSNPCSFFFFKCTQAYEFKCEFTITTIRILKIPNTSAEQMADMWKRGCYF